MLDYIINFLSEEKRSPAKVRSNRVQSSHFLYFSTFVYFTYRRSVIQIRSSAKPGLFPGGGGVLPIMAYKGRLRPKGVPFSGFKYKKG